MFLLSLSQALVVVANERDWGNSSEDIISLRVFNEHEGKCAVGFEGVHGKMVLGKEMQKEEDCWSSVMKKSCAWQTYGFTRKRKGKSHIVQVNGKLKFILCLRRKIQQMS